MNNQFESNQLTPPKKKSKLFLIGMPFLIVLVGVIGFSVLKGMATIPDKIPTEIKAPLVDVLSIEPKKITFTIASQGSVVPHTQTNLISEVSGQVIKVSPKLRVGGYFAKGEMLLEIDPITYDVALLEAESRLGSMQANLIQEQARADQAEDEWLLTGKTTEQAPILALRIPQLQKAKADVKAAEADLKEAQTKLKRTQIIAPYEALITEKNVDIGQYVTVNSLIVKTLAIDYAEVRLPIKQADLQYLNLPKVNEVGNKSRKVIISSDQAGETLYWDSYIARYEGVVNSKSRVHYLVAQIDDPYNLINDNNDAELRIGMFVKAKIAGKSFDNIVALPHEVIRGESVYLINEDKTLSIQAIKVLRSDPVFVYVKNNFKEEQRIIKTKIRTAVNGMALRVRGEEAIEKPDPEPEKQELSLAQVQGK